ncbi:hypothetical protein BOX15_Mlig000081g2, partial [Macrostomum lignano]
AKAQQLGKNGSQNGGGGGGGADSGLCSEPSSSSGEFAAELAAVRSWRNGAGYQSDDDELDSRTPDEAESAADWLEQTGSPLLADIARRLLQSSPMSTSTESASTASSNAIGDHQAGADLSAADSALDAHYQRMSRKQLNAVMKRIATLKAKRGLASRQDVRQLFSEAGVAGTAAATSGVADADTGSEDTGDSEDDLLQVTGRTAAPVAGATPLHADQAPSVSSSGATPVATSGLEQYPTFVLPNNRLGNASIFDFSEPDRQQIRALAHLELAALFDKYDCDPAFRKPSSRGRSASRRSVVASCFGVPLDQLVAKESGSSSSDGVPQLVRWIVGQLERPEALRTEGLFRVPGSLQRIRQARERAESAGIKALMADTEQQHQRLTADWHDLAGLLKAFLRELPEPLTSTAYADFYLKLRCIQHDMDRLLGLNLLVLLLPTPNCSTLRLMVDLFAKVIEQHKHNRMNLKAIATVMAPNLFAIQSSKKAQREGANLLAETGNLIGLVEMLIKYRTIVWSVPEFLIKQLREPPNKLSQLASTSGGGGASSAKKAAKLLRKQAAAAAAKTPVSSLAAAVVDSPVFNSSTSATSIQNQQVSISVHQASTNRSQLVPISPSTTAAEVLHGLGCDPSTTSLYEVGGNINERRLPGNTQIYYLLKINPTCSWAVK